MPGWSGFELCFPWIGGVGAVALLLLLFATRTLRNDRSRSRWRDPFWLSALGLAAYLLHNLEEYGRDAIGRVNGFPQDMAAILKLPPYPDSPLPPLYFVAVNVTAFWIAAPLATLAGRHRPLVGYAIYSIILVNLFFHLVPLLVGPGYVAGTLSALVLFLPLCTWMILTSFGPGRMRYQALALLVAAGIVFHAVLTASMFFFLRGTISLTSLVMIQVANPFMLMLILALGEQWRGGRWIRHVAAAPR